ncbi:MAG TPA: hypothetical protein PKD85_01625 [Saprospiraceae bacterium]|nr:hypothetical protein [Saprospiraceae bacterium]
MKLKKGKIIEYNEKEYSNQIKLWKESGSIIPPPETVKRSIIIEYQKKYKLDFFIETGTYKGGTVEILSPMFKKLFTIELSKLLYLISKERLKIIKNITFLFGNSIVKLPIVFSEVNSPALIWLDGHYSGGITAKGVSECPIMGELDAIKRYGKNLNHIILIDDMRCFDGLGDYPSIERLKEEIAKINSRYQITVEDDILRAVI